MRLGSETDHALRDRAANFPLAHSSLLALVATSEWLRVCRLAAEQLQLRLLTEPVSRDRLGFGTNFGYSKDGCSCGC
jgi:hypothetical protein